MEVVFEVDKPILL